MALSKCGLVPKFSSYLNLIRFSNKLTTFSYLNHTYGDVRDNYMRFCTNRVAVGQATNSSNEKSILQLLKIRWNHLSLNLQQNATGLYMKTDEVNFEDFAKAFDLPDTFMSWVLVRELHVWMLMVRCMAEGKSGKIMRNSLVEAMWVDIEYRLKKLAHIPASLKKIELRNMNDQFRAAIFAYDEGLQGDDKVLAGAVWRTLFMSKCDDPECIESCVRYMRQNIAMLDQISFDELRENKHSFTPLLSKDGHLLLT